MNLLVHLDALLQEQSVTGAAARLHTSPAAMSRALARIRRIVGDPVLVRAGQRMVMTPRALALRDDTHAVVEAGRALLVPGPDLDPGGLVRSFSVQASDAVLAELSTPLLTDLSRVSPGVTVRFLPEAVEGGPALRDGIVDVEIGVLDHVDPETRTAELLRTRFVGAVRADHPLTRGDVTPQRFAEARHIGVSRRGRVHGPIDARLAELGLRRHVAVVLPSHTAALLLAAETDLVCLAPSGLGDDPTRPLGLRTFAVPLDLPPVVIGMAWHPRTDADPAQRWFRDRIRAAARAGGRENRIGSVAE
ncbi:LysR family transcriptional regulator [Actinomycetes bacterium KLBMP 9759]